MHRRADRLVRYPVSRLLGRALAAAALVAVLPGLAAGQDPFTASASPNPVTLQAGGAAVGVTVTTTIVGALREPITYSFTGFPAGVSTGGAQTVNVPYPAVTFGFNAAGTVPEGTYTGSLVGTTPASTVTVPMTVVVQRPDFTLSANPGSVTVVAGESGTVTVAVAGTGGFTGSVNVVSSAPASLSVQPASLAIPAAGSQTIAIAAAASATPATATVTFSGTAPGVDGARTASVNVTIRARPPVIDAVTPAAVTAGTRENVLRVTGRDFDPAAVITSVDPAVQVLRARVMSSTSAEVVVAARTDAPAGPYRLDLRNPDGAAAAGGALLMVHPASSLAGPLAVRDVQIVAPRPGQIVAEDEQIHAHALLATSGMGTVVGTWLLDGVPFDRFTRIVSSGHPVEVRSAIPIPVSFTGEHRLELVIENPRSLPPQQVAFFQAPDRRSALRVLAPDPAGVIDPAAPVFRWTLVPGASGYEIELRYRNAGAETPAPWTVVRRRVTDPAWQPERALVERLLEAETRLRVRAVFPGEVFGEHTGWQEFTFAAEEDRPEPREEPEADSGSGLRQSMHDAGPFWLASDHGLGGPTIAAALFDRGGAARFNGARSRDAPADAIRQFDLAVGLTTTAETPSLPGPSALTRLQLSSQTDVHGHRFMHQVSGDFTASQDMGDPWHSRAESRSWLARLGLANGELRPDARIGFAPPSFFDRSEFLSVFTSGGGVQGRIRTSAGWVSYYRTVKLSADGPLAGPEPTVSAAAYEIPSDDGRFVLRATTLHVTDRPVDGFSAGGTGEAFGLLASADVASWLALVGETAFGKFRPGEDSFQEKTDGNAVRVSAGGGAGTFGYALAVGRTGAGFVNPVNPGFTPGGQSGRTRAEFSLNNTFFGRASVSGSYSHVRSGSAGSVTEPRTTENGTNLSLSLPVSSRVSLSLGGNLTGQRGDGVEEVALPATDRTQKGVHLSLTEALGPVQLTQSVSWQDLSDRVQPWADQRVTDVRLGAHGSVHRLVNVSASVSETRMNGSPEYGGSRQRLLSVQPSVTVWNTGVRLTPRAAFGRSSSELQDGALRTSQYQLGARWTAPWTAVPVAAEISSDWNRSWSDLDEERPSFDRRTVFSLSLNWRADRVW